jgi:multiple sugar transport system ATP-binding protein
MAAVEFRNVRKSFGPVEVIKGVDVRIEDNEFAVFVGPSGCGKSTMLRMLAGLEKPTSGKVLIDGEVVNDRRPVDRGIAMVFQSYALYPHMSVYENMAFGLEQVRTPKAEIDRRVREAAGMLQIGELLQRRPKELSGGQRQRVAIGRSIVRQPRAFLFDEPLSNLDASLRSQMRVELGALHERLRTTMIYVTHDQIEAMTLADRIVVFNDGRIEQIGSPQEVYERPNSRFVAEFLGSPRMNVTDCTVESGSGSVTCAFADGQRVPLKFANTSAFAGRATWVGVRPEDLSIAAPDVQGLAGMVKHVEYLGNELLVYIVFPFGKTMVLKSTTDSAVRVGQSLSVQLRENGLHFFDRDGLRLN